MGYMCSQQNADAITVCPVLAASRSSSLPLPVHPSLTLPKALVCGATRCAFACCRDNILFGRAWQQERYEAVLKACALEADLQQMTEGDATLIGDRGATLSGGQRARLSLARGLYQVLCLLL